MNFALFRIDVSVVLSALRFCSHNKHVDDVARSHAGPTIFVTCDLI